MNFAIIENDTVVNVIVCDSLELAKSLTGTEEIIDADEHKAYMGHIKINGLWFPPSPYPSWILDTDSRVWNPPVPIPLDEKSYKWDEGTLSWIEM